jgi:hypothetical protein
MRYNDLMKRGKQFGSASLCALLLSLPLPGPAFADQAEAQVGVPEPEASAEPTTEESDEAAVAQIPSDASPPIAAEPIEAVHRPSGFWGPVAVAADLLVMRPVGLVSLAAAGAAFVVVSPVAAATGTLGDRVDTLGDRAANVFTRPLGAL